MELELKIEEICREVRKNFGEDMATLIKKYVDASIGIATESALEDIKKSGLSDDDKLARVKYVEHILADIIPSHAIMLREIGRGNFEGYLDKEIKKL